MKEPPNPPRHTLLTAGIYSLVLAVGIWLAARARPNTLPADTPIRASNLTIRATASIYVQARTFQALMTGMGLAALGALIDANAVLTPGYYLTRLSAGVQFMLLVGGASLLTMGLGGISLRQMRQLGVSITRRTITPVVAVTLLAFALRIWALDTAVHTFVMDETWFTESVNIYHRDPNIPLLLPDINATSYTGVYSYLQKLVVDILGHSLAALRMPSVIFGTLTIPALYFLAISLFDKRTALIAALLLAVFPPHVHFSRLGINNIVDPFFGVMALALLMHGLQADKNGQRRAYFATAGTMLGFTHYFYDAGRLLFLSLILLWIIGAVLFKRLQKRDLPWLVLTLFAFAVVAAPVYTTLVSQHHMLVTRMEDMPWGKKYLEIVFHASPPADIGETVVTYAERYVLPVMEHYVVTPDQPDYFYGGSWAMLQPYLVPLFALGLLAALWRIRHRGYALLVLWLVLTTLGISLVYPPTWTVRYPVVFPALMLITAIGIVTIGSWFGKSSGRVMWGLTSVLVVLQIGYYFGIHLPAYNQQIRPYPDAVDAMYRVVEFRPRTQVHFVTDAPLDDYFLHTLDEFWGLRFTISRLHPSELTMANLTSLPQGLDQVFLVPAADTTTPRLLAEYLDVQPPEYSPYGISLDKQYVLYWVSRVK